MIRENADRTMLVRKITDQENTDQDNYWSENGGTENYEIVCSGEY